MVLAGTYRLKSKSPLISIDSFDPFDPGLLVSEVA
jgi:hypothetical protein